MEVGLRTKKGTHTLMQEVQSCVFLALVIPVKGMRNKKNRNKKSGRGGAFIVVMTPPLSNGDKAWIRSTTEVIWLKGIRARKEDGQETKARRERWVFEWRQ